MPNFFKENDTAIRIETTKSEVVELSKLKGDKSSLVMQIDDLVSRHNKTIEAIETKIAAIDVLINEATKLGIVEGVAGDNGNGAEPVKVKL